MRVIHPCRLFGTLQQDIGIAGQAISGGASLSGIDEPIRTDGGGYVTAQFTQGSLLTPDQNKAWRAITTGFDGGSAQAIILFGDRRHQPVTAVARVPHSDGTPFSDGTLYVTGGAVASVNTIQNGQTGGLRATKMRINAVTPIPIVGGEWFSIVHTTWGKRAYNIMSVVDNGNGTLDIEFRPPLREATVAGANVDFENPGCIMRTAQATSNQFNYPRIGVASLSLVEDMRKPTS